MQIKTAEITYEVRMSRAELITLFIALATSSMAGRFQEMTREHQTYKIAPDEAKRINQEVEYLYPDLEKMLLEHDVISPAF